MLGGNYRRLDQFPEALAAFTRGRAIEESEKLEVPSSYNLVNAITLPLEFDRQTALQPEAALALGRAIAAIKWQVRLEERRNDRWAWADLGQCQLLLGDLEGAKTSYERVRELGNVHLRIGCRGPSPTPESARIGPEGERGVGAGHRLDALVSGPAKRCMGGATQILSRLPLRSEMALP